MAARTDGQLADWKRAIAELHKQRRQRGRRRGAVASPAVGMIRRPPMDGRIDGDGDGAHGDDGDHPDDHPGPS